MRQGCDGNPREVYCDGKARLPSKELADQVARRCNRTGRHERAHAYKCRACGDWHIGSTMTPRPIRRRMREDTQA